jgi:signal transduction histidine kinase
MVNKFFDKIANRTRITFLAAFLLLLFSYILTFISTQKVITQDYWINHTNEIIHNLDNVLAYVNKSESAFRGYIISGNQHLLDEYGQSEIDTYNTFRKLKELVNDNDEQQGKLDTLHGLIDQKFLWIREVIPVLSREKDSVTKILEDNNQGVTETRDLESQIRQMQREEKALWNVRSQKVSEYSDLIRFFNIISIFTAILLTLFSIFVFNKENKAKREADLKATQFRDQLEHRVAQLAELNAELIQLRSMEKYSVTGRIARTIAHEVRNPLTNINLAIEQLRSEFESTDTTELLFNMVSRNSERINQLVSDLLNTTRVAELSFSEVSINDVLDETLELAMDRLELNHTKIVKNYERDICKISVDVPKIKIAFLNVIVNAIEAMPANGILRIETFKKNSFCCVKISDTGKGMAKQEVSRLFEPYFTTKEKGNGLGLANSQNIILGHNGGISAESEPGKGTTFTITLRFAQ